MDIIEVIKQKKFQDLTAQERAEIRDLASSEDEYNAVREVYLMNSAFISNAPTPSENVKSRLDDLFHEVHPKVWLQAYHRHSDFSIPRALFDMHL